MSTISSVQQIVSVIRQEVRARASVALSERKRRAIARSRGDGPDHGRLSALIEKRVDAIDRSDPDKERKVFRLFLESVFLAEFGDALINNPAFYQMVGDIHAQMEAEPALAAQMREATSILLNKQDGN